MVFSSKFSYFAYLIDADTYYFYTPLRVAPADFCQKWHLLPARLAPSRPEVRDRNPAFPVEEPPRLAIEIRKDRR